jgi:hypothetical protein
MSSRATDAPERATRRRIGLPELVISLIGLVTLGAALVTSTPLLRSSSYGIDHRVFPTTTDQAPLVFELPAEDGAARFESILPHGCVQVSAPSVSPTRSCNRDLHCADGPLPTHASTFEVFRIPDTNNYYVTTGSTCNSACCDWRGASFGGDGRRLDDGPLQRLALRLGVPGAIALGVGAICLGRTLKRPERTASRVAGLAAFGLAITLAWLNL